MLKLINKFFHINDTEDVNLEDAIKFIKQQKKINLHNIEKIKEMGFNTDDMTYWDNIYDFIIVKLKSMRK